MRRLVMCLHESQCAPKWLAEFENIFLMLYSRSGSTPRGLGIPETLPPVSNNLFKWYLPVMLPGAPWRKDNMILLAEVIKQRSGKCVLQNSAWSGK